MEDMISTEDELTIIMVIAFLTWLFIQDQKGARK